MLHITQYLVILLPFYIIAAETPLFSDVQPSQDDFIDILTIDTNALQNFFATLRPLDIDYYASLQEPHYAEPSASPEPASPEPASPIPPIPPIPLPDDYPHIPNAKPLLLKPNGTPYIRGPYKKRTEKNIKRNIQTGVLPSHPNYQKIYSALYAQVVKQQNPDM